MTLSEKFCLCLSGPIGWLIIALAEDRERARRRLAARRRLQRQKRISRRRIN